MANLSFCCADDLCVKAREMCTLRDKPAWIERPKRTASVIVRFDGAPQLLFKMRNPSTWGSARSGAEVQHDSCTYFIGGGSNIIVERCLEVLLSFVWWHDLRVAFAARGFTRISAFPCRVGFALDLKVRREDSLRVLMLKLILPSNLTGPADIVTMRYESSTAAVLLTIPALVEDPTADRIADFCFRTLSEYAGTASMDLAVAQGVQPSETGRVA